MVENREPNEISNIARLAVASSLAVSSLGGGSAVNARAQKLIEASERIPNKEEIHTPPPVSEDSLYPTYSIPLPPERVMPFISEINEKTMGNEQENLEVGREVDEILNLVPELKFDEKGNLYFESEDGQLKSILLSETKRYLVAWPYEQMKDVKFFLLHYDAAPQTLKSGEYRTVFNTLNGLNSRLLSVQFCVDSYPVTNRLEEGKGLGIMLTQQPNEIPFKAEHVLIGKNLSTGAPDLNRVKTADLFSELGIKSELTTFVQSGNIDFDAYALGVEQVGTRFSDDFPHQFPPEQQIANMLGLIKAVSKRYDIPVWDVIAHHEVQEKADPGEEYMLTIRYLLGIMYMRDREGFANDFLGGDSLGEYFVKLKQYAIKKMGEERYSKWDRVYGMDEVMSKTTETTNSNLGEMGNPILIE